MRRAFAGVAALVLAAALGLSLPVSGDPPGEEEQLRQIKSDVFDEKWDALLDHCDQFIAAFPKSSSLPRTYYYRAKALQHLTGRDQDALTAYGEFVDRFPGETLLREDALISRFSLAKSLWLKGTKDAINILMKGLTETGYPRVYAAVQISHLDNVPARARALPVLKDCATGEKDAEVRNECTLAILRIDPNSLPKAVPPPDTVTSAAAEPKLIRLEVREKSTGKVKVAVNLPVAFAEALLQSLSEFDRGQVTDELKNRGIDVNNIWKSLKTLGRQTLVQIDTEDENIRVWLE
jgi:hypothetical protein